MIIFRGVTMHLVTIRFVLRYTACDILNGTIFTIHISDILFIQELSIGEDFRRQDLWLDRLLYVVWFVFRNKEIPNFYSTERIHLCCLSFEILIALMFLCTYIVLRASSCVTFIVIFATRASIVCIDSGTCDTIHVSLALAIRFFDISINRYTPNNIVVTDCYLFLQARFFFFFRGTFNIQASNAIHVLVMRYQSLEINYHTAPNNKSTALPILQKLISIMVCLLGRAE